MSYFKTSFSNGELESTVDITLPRSDTLEIIEDGVGLSNPQLSHGRRRMLDLVNRLHSTGVQVDIDLPQIAVIGSQSAGKSSLIESISGITLPRAAGTCTRCPTECRLSRSEEAWKCIVSLRFITDNKGQPLGQARNEIFGATIFNKAEVEDRIKRAQRAILSPNKARKSFLEGDDEDVEVSELSFSTNCVTLQISGPDVADLSFCDLPGLIASVSSSRGSSSDISLVEGLVTSYIKKASCIILLTVACETDFENQGAHRLAKQHDPEGKRTIGVLTKPDRIPMGEEANWLPFIRNEKEPLENNWYCVKQPSSNDIKQKITWTEARQREDEYFSMTAPWSDLDTMYQKYLRTSNLVERLSSILSDLISKRLPQIQDELEKSTLKAREALNALPKAPSSDPLNEIAALLHVFVSDVFQHVEGVSDEHGLLQVIRPAQEKFRQEVRSTAPKFHPFERKYGSSKKLAKARFLANEEEQSGVETDPEDDQSDRHVDLNGAYRDLKKRKQTETELIFIDDVYDRAHRARTRELPGNYPFVVQETFITAIIKEWRYPAVVLCKTVHTLILEHCKKLVTKHFGVFGQGTLEQRVKTIIQKHISECLQRAEERIDWLLKLEDRPFSLNTHYLTDYKYKFLAHYKGSRKKDQKAELMDTIENYRPAASQNLLGRSKMVEHQETGLAKVLSGLAEMGLSGIKPEDIPKLLPPDRMEHALVIMADVRAYFQVAYKRFADNVPLAIDYELVRGIERDLLQMLYGRLGINGPEGRRICKELAQENPHVADRREELQKKLERLRIASSELMHMGA